MNSYSFPPFLAFDCLFLLGAVLMIGLVGLIVTAKRTFDLIGKTHNYKKRFESLEFESSPGSPGSTGSVYIPEWEKAEFQNLETGRQSLGQTPAKSVRKIHLKCRRKPNNTRYQGKHRLDQSE